MKARHTCHFPKRRTRLAMDLPRVLDDVCCGRIRAARHRLGTRAAAA